MMIESGLVFFAEMRSSYEYDYASLACFVIEKFVVLIRNKNSANFTMFQ